MIETRALEQTVQPTAGGHPAPEESRAGNLALVTWSRFPTAAIETAIHKRAAVERAITPKVVKREGASLECAGDELCAAE